MEPFPTLTPDELHSLLQASGATCIDIRGKTDYKQSHIPEARSIPFEKLDDTVSQLQTIKTPLVIVDAGNEWGATAVQRLETFGIAAKVLRGGMPAWIAAGYPVERHRLNRLRLLLPALIPLAIILTFFLIGQKTRDHLCCRLTHGSIGSMECHWFDKTKYDQRTLLLFSEWENIKDARQDFLQCKQERSITFDRLYTAAERTMLHKVVTVMNKSSLPPSRDKRDFISLSRYYWPDPATKNGLPYIRHDGQTNPETYSSTYDKRSIESMVDDVRVLSLGYYLFGEDSFAEKAATQLRAWFIDPKTGMNPHLEFAGYIPGSTKGRGVVPFDELPDILDAITLVSASDHWTAEDDAAMRDWMTKYLQWLESSPVALDEKNRNNNRGTWYDVQAGSLELYLGNVQKVRQRMQQAKTKRIRVQIEPNGQQPLETERTRAWLYSCYNLKALMDLADIAKNAGVDLWNYEAPNGAGIKQAIDYLIPFATGEQEWPWGDEPADPQYLIPILQRASYSYDDERYRKLAEQFIPPESTLQDLINVKWPTD